MTHLDFNLIIFSICFWAAKCYTKQLIGKVDEVIHMSKSNMFIPTNNVYTSKIEESKVKHKILIARGGRSFPNDSVMNSFRPKIVLDKIKSGDDIYYFGVGSNMLRSKVENRGKFLNNTGGNWSSIVLKSFSPAVTKDYRLGELFIVTCLYIFK